MLILRKKKRLAKKSFLSFVLVLFVFSNVSMAVVCSRLKDVSAGEKHTLALAEDNTLWACGYGPLGLGSGVNQVLALQRVHGPNDVGYLEDINDFDAGWIHSLAVDANGTIWAWGTDTYGQLGNGTGGSSDFPIKVHGVNDVGYLEDIAAVSAGRSGLHSLAVDSNGYAYAWGYNNHGQCGNGENGTTDILTPVKVFDSDPNTEDVYLGDEVTVIAVDAGVNHSLALDTDGHVWEWGINNNSNIPKKVRGEGGVGYLENIVAISTRNYSMVLDTNGNVWTWTSGYPVKVPGGEMGTTYLENITAVAAGDYKMALDSNGNVWEWRTGPYPVKVQDGKMETESGYLEGIIAIDSGFYEFRVAVCENGYGWGWGTNINGQLGIGTTQSPGEPTQMLCAVITDFLYFDKTATIQGSEPNCARPFIEDNYLVYDVNYGNPITNPDDPNYHGTVYDVNIVDHLPLEVDYYSVTGGGVYDTDTNTVKWTIGELAPGDSNSFTLTTKVNEYARPGGEISNFVEMTADMYYSYATDTVSVCNWGTEIIYVDEDANDPNSFNNGTTWDDAYNLLQDGFTGARNCGASVTAIWVAAGTYKPVEDTTVSEYWKKSFELPENVGLFGHFAGTETSPGDRNFSDANNTTTLEGLIDQGSNQKVLNVVKAASPNSIIDGFTIQNSYLGAGIYLDDADVAIVNCKLKSNEYYGIEARNDSRLDIHNCTFIDNYNSAVYSSASQPDISYCSFDGNSTTSQGLNLVSGSSINVTDSIFKNHTDRGIYIRSSSNLTLKNSVVRHSGDEGIYLFSNPNTTIINNWIHDNGDAGIYFINPVSSPLIRNNTIYNNSTCGIRLNSGADPNILNCIIWGNTSGDLDGTFNDVNYCSLQTSRGTDNITGDPGFMNVATDPNDLHIAEDSNCVDNGDPNGSYGDETDIDGEERIKYGRVDMGADEYYWSPADFDRDEIVNFLDYAIFAAAWQTDDPNISLDDDNDVDIDDLALFCKDWLWEVGWGDTQWMRAMGGGGGRGTDGDLMLPDAKASLAARPERLIAKSQKFYDIIPANTVSALRRAEEAKRQRIDEVKDTKDILEWLDEIWLNGEIDWTEEKYLEFRKSVEDSLQ